MTYRVEIKERAQDDLYRLAKNEPKAFDKVQRLIKELEEHPTTGTGHPEPLRGDHAGQWSRRITDKHRLVYQIYETEVVVLVLTAYGHYEDK